MCRTAGWRSPSLIIAIPVPLPSRGAAASLPARRRHEQGGKVPAPGEAAELSTEERGGRVIKYSFYSWQSSYLGLLVSCALLQVLSAGEVTPVLVAARRRWHQLYEGDRAAVPGGKGTAALGEVLVGHLAQGTMVVDIHPKYKLLISSHQHPVTQAESQRLQGNPAHPKGC